MLHYCAPPLNLEGLIGFTFQLLAGSFVVVIHTVENSITSLKLERCHMVIYGTARALQVLYANKQTSPKDKISKFERNPSHNLFASSYHKNLSLL